MATFMRGAKILGRLARRVPVKQLNGAVTKASNQNFRVKGDISSEVPFFISRHLSSAVTEDVSWTSDVPLNPTEALFKRIEDTLKTRRRVYKNDLVQMIKGVKDSEIPLSDHQGFQMLKYTGSVLAMETPAERQAFFHQVWEALPKLGVVYTAAHYNSALRIRLENEEEFSSTDVLSEMATAGVSPNRLTYQLLISNYCNHGDVEGASKILEHMKSQNLPINETVFNSMIYGHLKKGDTAGAEEVLHTMRSMRLEPSMDTYKQFLLGYAEKGDIDGLEQTLVEAEKDEVSLHHKPFLEAGFILAKNDRLDLVTRLFEKLPMRAGFVVDAYNMMYQMIAQGLDDAAYKVFSCIGHPQVAPDQEAVPYGRGLLRSLIANERPVSKVIEILEDMIASGSSTDNLLILGNFALRTASPEYALKVFEAIKEKGHPVRAHFYWSICNKYKKDKNIEGLYNVMRSMHRLLDESDDQVYLLCHFVYIPLITMGEVQDDVINKIHDAGFTNKDTNSIKLIARIHEGDVEEAITLLDQGDLIVSPPSVRAVIQNCLKKTQDWQSLLQLIGKIKSQWPSGMGGNLDLNSEVIGHIMKKITLTQDDLTKLVDMVVEKDLKQMTGQVEKLKQELLEQNVPSEVVQKLDELGVIETKQLLQLTPEQLNKTSLPDLENMYTEAKTRNIRNLNMLEKWLLIKYCNAGKLEQAENIKALLDSRGFVYTVDVLASLGVLAARHKKDVEEAKGYMNKFQERYPETMLRPELVLNIAIGLAQEGRVEDAQQSLRDYAQKYSKLMDDWKLRESYQYSGLCRELLKACGKSSSPASTRDTMELLFDLGFIKPGTFDLLTQLMTSYLTQEDSDSIVNAMEECVTKYSRTPMFSEVFRFFINREDPDRLQKVVDLATAVQGEMNVLNSLIVNFIECGKVKQARKIVDTPGLRAVNKVLMQNGDQLALQKKITELEQLADVTRPLFGIDRDAMLFQLTKAYTYVDDLEKLKDILTRFEEENVTPRPRTLRYIAKVLESKGLEVPFEVPEQAPLSRAAQLKATSSLEEEALAAMKAQNMDEISSVFKKATDAGTPISSNFKMELANQMRKDKLESTLRGYLHLLGEEGDTDSLLLVRQLPMSNNMQMFTTQRLFMAYINSNRGGEVVDFLHNNPSLIPKYSSTRGLMHLSEKSPGQWPKMEEAILNHHQKNPRNMLCLNHVFNMYVLTDRVDQATAMLEEYPNFRSRVNLLMSTEEAKKSGREDLLHQILNIARSVDPKKSAMPYSQLILLKCEQGDWQGALKYYNEALESEVPQESLLLRSLATLENQLQQNNQAVPWEPGTLEERRKRRTEAANASSSSSSDSSSSGSDSSDDEQIQNRH